MKGKQKILLLVCSVIAVVSVSGMAAYALLKTVTETKTNVFASDKSISIDLTEPQWERYGKEAAKVYVPGQTIDKDPTVSLNDESISAYVALKVQFFDEKNNELTFREFADRYLYGGSELANAGIDWSKDWTFIGNANSDLEMMNMQAGLCICIISRLIKIMPIQILKKMFQSLYLLKCI